MSLPRYSKYKASGVEWFNEAPDHWAVLPCRAFVTEKVEKNEGAVNQDYLSLMANVGILPYEEKGDVGNKKPEDLSKCKLVAKGDLVINSMNYGIGSYGLSPLDGVCSSVYIVLRPKLDVIESRFAFRIFENRLFQSYAQSFGNGILEHRAAINWDILKAVGVGIPPQDEQRAILAFLDRETGKIDALVAEQQKLIALLKEKRQAVISHAVTKGLNPDAPMKPSGIEWLGDVPEHWEVRPMRRVISRIEQGWSPECFSRIADDNEWGVLKAGCVNWGEFRESENKALPMELSPVLEYEIQAGDILMSRANGSPELVGSTAIVRDVRPMLMLSDKIFRIRLAAGMNPELFVAVLNSRPLRCQIEVALSGGNGLANNLPQSMLMGFFLCVPPSPEQHAICNFLEREKKKLDSLTLEADRAIALLQERRAALISAAVTGQIDVRGLVTADAAMPAAVHG